MTEEKELKIVRYNKERNYFDLVDWSALEGHSVSIILLSELSLLQRP